MGDDISDFSAMAHYEYDGTPLLPNSSSKLTQVRNGMAMAVLFMINLLNYMDRFAIAGVLEKIQTFYSIKNSEGGLLQTAFVCSYMALAPLFGYLGDRYSRKLMIIAGVTLWSLTTLAGSFVPKHLFGVFLALRCLVGVGEASYSCVAPTIIADMYKGTMRTRMLALFNIAVPLGSGLGYIVGSYVEKLTGHWQWALRVTPVFGAICVFLLIVLVREPERGSNEGGQVHKTSSFISDVKQVLKIKSFFFITLGFTWVSFALGSLSWWGPIFLEKAHVLADETNNEDAKKHVPLFFGLITCAAGIIGVILGSEVANRYRQKNPCGDPLVCGFAVILGVPFLLFVLLLSKDNLILVWILIFCAETLFCSNWALISDMLMYIVIPTRRSTASSIQIFVMHLLGDASSPYIIGVISDYFRDGNEDRLSDWVSLRNALILTPFVATLGGAAFLFASFYIVQDRRRAEATTALSRRSNDIGLHQKA